MSKAVDGINLDWSYEVTKAPFVFFFLGQLLFMWVGYSQVLPSQTQVVLV